MAVIRHYQHHFRFSYTNTLKHHLFISLLTLGLLLIFLGWIIHTASPSSAINLDQISPTTLLLATLSSFYRLAIAYIFALFISIPLSLLVVASDKTEKFLLPVIDIIQSIPVLAFFPILVLFFIQYKQLDFAAVFILFLAMVWNLVFSMVGGLKTIPSDIEDVAKVFQVKGFKKLTDITLPAVLPYIITGSLLAWGQGWNIVIVAEALHSFVPAGSSSQDLLGLGSLLVNSLNSGKTSVFLASLAVMIVVIGLLNLFVWQRLIHLTERFRFD